MKLPIRMKLLICVMVMTCSVAYLGRKLMQNIEAGGDLYVTPAARINFVLLAIVLFHSSLLSLNWYLNSYHRSKVTAFNKRVDATLDDIRLALFGPRL